jgi:putative phage-type endonuclease
MAESNTDEDKQTLIENKSNAEKVLTRQLKFPQKSVEWINARNHLLTSSDVAAALDCNSYESSLELLKKKCSPLENTLLLNNNSINHGVLFEPIACTIFEKITDQKVIECGLVVHDEHRFIGASPDGVILNGKLLEIKCPYSRNIKHGIIPYYYWIQVQIQMECCNLNETYFFQCKFDKLNKKPEPDEYKHWGVLNKDNNTSPIVYWGLVKYTLEIIKRDRIWFDNNIQRLAEFWSNVLHYRKVGLLKLNKDIEKNQISYNLNNKILEVCPLSQLSVGIQSHDQLSLVIPNSLQVRDDNIEYTSDVISNFSSVPKQDNYSNNTVNHIQGSISPIITSIPIQPPMDWSKWVSATSTKNSVINDPLLDWLNEYGKGTKRRKTGNSVYDSKMEKYEDDTKNASPFLHYIQDAGLKFEKEIVAYLYKKFRGQVKTIANPYQARQQGKYDETLEAMKSGTPIIYQAVLHNAKDKTYGICDLVVRSDYLNQIVKTSILTKEEAKIPCKFSRRWHYRVIDIKHSSLALRADGTHLLNSGSIPAHKTQLYIYNQAIAYAQEYNPNNSYILGSKWSYTKCGERFNGIGWFDRVGVINYSKIDSEYKTRTKAAVDWIRTVRLEGHKWSINPPSRKELYPNMKNTNDNPWNSTKKSIAENIGEITSVWMCGIRNRNIALEKGITSWKDINCTAESLGIKGTKTASVVNAILNINRGTEHYKPKKINNKLSRYKVEFFIDFETVNSIVEPINNGFPTTKSDTFLFMIGVGWRINDGKSGHWNYKHFTTEIIDFDGPEEKENFIAFHLYIIEILEKYNASKDFVIYHWSHAERIIYENIAEKYYDSIYDFHDAIYWNWYDLLQVFKDEPIVIKGAFNFGLKSISKALFNHGYIKSVWVDDGITDGLNAMVKAVECSNDAISQDISMIDMPIMKQIIRYNEIDCKVLLEILSFLRHNLVKKRKRLISNTSNKRLKNT